MVVAALASASFIGASAGRVLLVAAAGSVPIAGVALGRGGGADRRERAWQIEAIGVATLGVTWIWAAFG